MQAIDIKGDVTLTAKVKAQMDDSPLALPPPQGAGGGTESFQSFAEAASKSTDSLKDNAAILKEFGNVMPEIIKNLRYMNSVVAQTAQSLPAIKKQVQSSGSSQNLENRINELHRQNVLGILNTGSNSLQALANGNTTGAGLNFMSGMSNTASNMSKMANLSGNGGMGKKLLGASGVLAAAVAIGKAANALSEKYEDAMPTIFGTGKAFGVTDNASAMNMWRTVNQYNSGTGLDTDEWNSVVQGLRRQGVGNGLGGTAAARRASEIAQTASRWAYATGGSADQYTELAGLMSRYGGSKNVSADFNRIVSAGYASGLNDSQIPEFLSGIQKVMEEGIAKGFTRSSTEVADTLLMFSKMSGNNAFWQGEQGAKMLNQMNVGISGATALSKTEDILVYRAFQNAYKDKEEEALGDTFVKNGGYVNMMQLIEKGINSENFGSIMQALNDVYGDDKTAKIEALKNMTGLNYTGAARLLNLNTNATETDLKKILTAPDNQNNETKWKHDLNVISQALADGGEKVFGLKLKAVDTISNFTEKIYNHLTGKKDTIIEPNKYIKPKDPTEEYNKNLATAEIEAKTLSESQQLWLTDSARDYHLDVGENGEGYLKLVDDISSWDPVKRRFVTREDGSGTQHFKTVKDKKGNYSTQFEGNASRNYYLPELLGYVFQPAISGMLDEYDPEGTITSEQLLTAVKNDKKAKNYAEKISNGGEITTKEMAQMNEHLKRIIQELAGVTVVENSSGKKTK